MTTRSVAVWRGAAAVAMVLWTGTAVAGLLGVRTDVPKISYAGVMGGLSYDPGTQQLNITATPTLFAFDGVQVVPVLPTGAPPKRTLSVQVKVNTFGNLIGGVPGDDLVITGKVTVIIAGVPTTFQGELLKGEVSAFGWAELGASDQFDLRFTPTGGALAQFYCDKVSLRVIAEFSTFTGSFTFAFIALPKNELGSDDVTVPTIQCPADITVECNKNDGGANGAYVNYQPTVIDNCDAANELEVTINPPSGSFFVLPDGQSNATYAVVVTAIDTSANTNSCSFNVTVKDSAPPLLGDIESPELGICMPSLAGPADAGVCYATITLDKPTATDCCQTNLLVTLTARDEEGNTILLQDHGSTVVGQFPVSHLGGSNSVVAVADDQHGNTSTKVCPIIVTDNEPPQLVDCMDRVVVATNCVVNAGHGDGDDDHDGHLCKLHHRHTKKCFARLSSWTKWWGWKRHCDGGDNGGDGKPVRMIVFQSPLALDNCDGPVEVSCTLSNGTPLADGTLLGVGVYHITCTAIDGSGNTNTCQSTLTVLGGLKVVVQDCLDDDNKADDIETDADVRNQFRVGCYVLCKVKLVDPCTGQDVTSQIRPSVTVKLDVTERKGSFTNSDFYKEIDENPATVGDTGTIMPYSNGAFQYWLPTSGYEKGTVNNTRFFRCDFQAYYNTNPDVMVGREDASMESQTY